MVVCLNIRKSMSEYQRHSASGVSRFIAAASCLARASSGPEILPLPPRLVPQVSTPSTSDISPVCSFSQLCWDCLFVWDLLTQELDGKHRGCLAHRIYGISVRIRILGTPQSERQENMKICKSRADYRRECEF